MNRIETRKSMREIYAQMRTLFGISVVVILLIELMNRRSFEQLFLFIAHRPWMFLFNVMIMVSVLSFGMLFRHMFATTTTLLVLMLMFGFVNFMVVCFRMQPFTTMDFLQVKDGLDIMPVYFNIFQRVLIFAGIALMFAAFIVLFIKAPKQPRGYFFRKLAVLVAFALCLVGINHIAVGTGVIEKRMENLVSAYHDYGFTYCFVRTFASSGIPKPSGYSNKVVEDIVTELGDETSVPVVSSRRASKQMPNIVYVQLESFFDVARELKEAEFSENPTPVFSELLKKYPSGALYVPSVGGGTANTEFEVLSGMNLDYFGAGEYPYNTILNNTTCESVCYNLRENEYASTAVHNYLGTFYGRNSIYAQLGFDAFVPMEYMQELEYNRQGWAKDTVLIGEIMQAMEATNVRDFVMAISVQSHGKYLDTLPEEGNEIQVLATPKSVNRVQLENFANELYEVDDFIGRLLQTIKEFDEPTIVVLYGDHLPGLGMQAEDMACGSIFQTSYVIWNNYGEQFVAPDLQAYRLTANVLKQLDIDTGLITRFHQAAAVDDVSGEYLDALEILEYDMLYGDHEATGGINPFTATDIKLGTKSIRITEVECSDSKLVVCGENFTESSIILLDGERQETAFVSSKILVAVPTDPQEDLKVAVAQVTKENIELGRTGNYNLALRPADGAE